MKKTIDDLDPADIRMYLAVSDCRRAMQRGVPALVAALECCRHRGVSGGDVVVTVVAELARVAHHECARARHRYQYYRQLPPRQAGNTATA